MPRNLITKSHFLSWLACPTLGWFEANSKEASAITPSLTPSEELRIQEGKEIGELARSIFPGGILINAKSNELALEQTQNHLRDTKVTALYEATFIYNGFIAKADILLRDKSGWNLIEVKSALHDDNSISSEHIDDLAYTFFVLSGAHLSLNSVELMRLSRNYRLGDSAEKLFKRFECKQPVSERAADFETSAGALQHDCSSLERPSPELSSLCKECRYFFSDCIGIGLSHPIIEIPRITAKSLSLLQKVKILEIKNIPAKFKLSDNQQRIVDSVKKGSPIINLARLEELLKQVHFPCYYLDFESVLTALPLFPKIAPYQVVLTQYSLHVLDAPGAEVRHFEFLAPHDRDARRDLIEDLLSKLGTMGSIVVYSNYEKVQLKSLAQEYSDLKVKIDDCIERLFDLREIFTSAFYHPEFCGSSSIKNVLPVLVPELSYLGLPIADGGSAVAMFVKMAKGQCDQSQIEEIRKNLLEYCQLDTLALVKLHQTMKAWLDNQQ